ncbi:MAG TPA: polysaccharide biosynthesis C-terminal domain-containing protein [Thermoleophilaceae bacterium]|nr:polysaccharide biosynthesis C-terminal domain-containing protein [Thermoleophilaceae bacterium]
MSMTPSHSTPEPAEAGGLQTSAAATATTAASVTRGGLWVTVALVLPQIYTLVVSVAAARYLGPHGMGRQSFIAFVEISLASIFTSGLTVALMRYVGETLGQDRPEVVRGLVVWAWRLVVAGGVPAAAVMIGIGLSGSAPRAAWYFAAVVCFMIILQTVPNAALAGTQRWRQNTTPGVVTGAIAVPATIGVLAAGGGITGMFAVEAAVAAGNLVWTSALARHALAGLSNEHTSAPRELKRDVLGYTGLMAGGVVLTFVVWKRSEFIFLDRYSGDTQIAYYSIAFAAVNALSIVPGVVSNVISPAFATLYGAGQRERLRSGYARSIRLLLLASLPLTAGALAVGPETVELVYGHDYAGVRTPLLIMLAAFPLVALSGGASALMVGLGRRLVPGVVGAAAAVVTLGLNWLLVPSHGATGAALANSGGQIAATVPIVIYAVTTIGGLSWRPLSIVRMALASAVTWAAAHLTVVAVHGGIEVPAGIAAGLLAFAACAPLLRVLPPEEVALVEEVAGGRLAGPARRVATVLSQGVFAARRVSETPEGTGSP